jgi:membrane protein DedA with SNARE-associated domain
MRLKKTDFSRANSWFGRHGSKAVFFCRFIPVVRSLISIPAGASRMPLHIFLPLTILGTAIWNTVLVCLGSFAGEAWESINDYIGLYSTIAVIILVLILLWLIARYIRRRRATGGESADGAEGK